MTKLALPRGAQIKAVSPDGARLLISLKEGDSGEPVQSDLWLLDLTLPRETLENPGLEQHRVCLTRFLDQEPLNAYWTRRGIFVSYWNKSTCEIARLSEGGEVEVWETQGLSVDTFFLNEAAQIFLRAVSDASR